MKNKNIKNGIEKRRYKRLKADLKLNVSNLFKQNNVNIRNIDSPITVTDISKSGIGFRSKSILPIDFYFSHYFPLICDLACKMHFVVWIISLVV